VIVLKVLVGVHGRDAGPIWRAVPPGRRIPVTGDEVERINWLDFFSHL